MLGIQAGAQSRGPSTSDRISALVLEHWPASWHLDRKQDPFAISVLFVQKVATLLELIGVAVVKFRCSPWLCVCM